LHFFIKKARARLHISFFLCIFAANLGKRRKMDTEHAIKLVKDTFQQQLSAMLRLRRVTAPLFVESGRGVNDDLTGVEQPVRFYVPELDRHCEIVHSLAKWKRMKLWRIQAAAGFGIYTDMNALRTFEKPDDIHSLYVDQWDWEKVINDTDRTVSYLKETVKKIYSCLKHTEFYIYDRYPAITPILPEEITFVFADELQRRFPNNTPKERENIVAKQYGAVFIIGIGGKMDDGSVHDGRAPDYDDWITETGDGHKGLNGDLLVWDPVLESALELSSMGIRVSPESLKAQLEERGCPERAKLYFHKRLLEGKLAPSIGGGIGQSRLCMYFLRKAHIGEIQVSTWPEKMLDECSKNGIHLL